MQMIIQNLKKLQREKLISILEIIATSTFHCHLHQKKGGNQTDQNQDIC